MWAAQRPALRWLVHSIPEVGSLELVPWELVAVVCSLGSRGRGQLGDLVWDSAPGGWEGGREASQVPAVVAPGEAAPARVLGGTRSPSWHQLAGRPSLLLPELL